MTDNNNKLRALVLAALMVFSVFAGTVALAGSAAADANTWSAQSADDVTIGQSSTTQSLVVNYGLDANDQENVTLDLSGYQDDISVTGQSVTTDGTNVNVENVNLNTSNEELTFTLNNTAGSSVTANVTMDLTLDTQGASTNSGTTLTATAEGAGSDTQLQFDVVDAQGNTGDAVLRKATHYDSEDEGAIIELAFDRDVNPTGTFTVGFEDGSTTDFTTSSGDVYSTGNGRVVIETGSVYSNVENVSVPDSVSSTDNLDGSGDVAVTFAPTTVNDDSDTSGYLGANVAFEAGNTSTTINFDGPSYSPTRGTGAGSQVYVVDTDDFDAGTYNATFGDTGMTGSIELSSLGLSVSASDVTTDSAVTATVEADDINRDVDVALLDSDDEVVDSTTLTIDSDGEATANFGQQAAGNYSVVATDVATGVEATTDVNVTEAATGEVEFTQNTYEVAQGGIAEITLDVSGTTMGTLVVGDVTESGYQANVTFTDVDEDGEVTVQFNTYNAGTTGDVVSAAGDDTANLISDDTNLDNLLAQNGYNLAVDTGHANNGTEVTTSGDADFGSLSIGPRSTDGMNLWTAPAGAASDEVFDSTLTEDETIAQDDWVVHQVSATGIDGLVDGNFSGALGNGLNVTVEQTEASTRPNRGPKTLNLSASGDAVALWADSENDSYYIAVDTETAVFDRGSSTTGLSANAGEEYTATFTIDDSRLVGEDDVSVNSSFEIVERTASLDETPVMVEAAEGQNITGSSSLAPGSEFRVVIESTGDTSPRFYNNPTATVEADGTWTITMDFSEQAEGDTFRVASSQFFSADGEVGAAATATPTATATPEETEEPETDTATATATATATDAPETDEPTPTATDEPDTTTTTTPGFGIAVALVALLAAALLAGRRE